MTSSGRRTALIVLGLWMLALGIPALLIRGLHGWTVWGIPGPALYAVVIVGGLAALALAWRAKPR
ncbi:hypothetical protein ACQHIV_42295 (plasmid) [Kribbella sp. GL6]|uniref:hypothetical protein n=1 Tax=Kribbella sp. GL6 TaxID=3419765 RepID=UPI003CFBE195